MGSDCDTSEEEEISELETVETPSDALATVTTPASAVPVGKIAANLVSEVEISYLNTVSEKEKRVIFSKSTEFTGESAEKESVGTYVLYNWTILEIIQISRVVSQHLSGTQIQRSYGLDYLSKISELLLRVTSNGILNQ